MVRQTGDGLGKRENFSRNYEIQTSLFVVPLTRDFQRIDERREEKTL